jgi:hypothetical protein
LLKLIKPMAKAKYNDIFLCKEYEARIMVFIKWKVVNTQ